MSPPKKKKLQPGFNTPFRGLSLPPKPPAPRPAAVTGPAPEPLRKAPSPPPMDEDTRLFLEAMGEVRPLADRPPAPEPTAPLPQRLDEDAEAVRELSELVDGRAPFNLADTDDFIEGAIADLDPRVRRRLRQGRFSNQAHVDLHGFTQEEAKEELERFLLESHRRGHRCVLVVHGRGLHSKDGIPVLKERMKVWLTQGRLARRVLGFCTAQPHDGGAGALYVLLRR